MAGHLRTRRSFVSDESGATAVEYGLISAFVFLVIISAVALTGSNLRSLWQTIGSAVAKAAG